MSSGTSIASASSHSESQTDSWTTPPSSLTCVSSHSPVQPTSTEALRTWLAQAFPASRSASPESNLPQATSGICGPQQLRSFAAYSLDPFCLKTSPDLFPADISEPSSLTWPRWGMWDDGEFWELPTLERHIGESDCGLLPTPTATDHKSECMNPSLVQNRLENSNKGVRLTEYLHRRTLPTPMAGNNHWGGRLDELGGSGNPFRGTEIGRLRLNPCWVEELMGWPIGWTDLKPLGTDRFQAWFSACGSCSHE